MPRRTDPQQYLVHPRLGEALAGARRSAGLTQAELVARVQQADPDARLSVHYLRKLENGSRSSLKRSTLTLVLDELGHSPNDLQIWFDTLDQPIQAFVDERTSANEPSEYAQAAEGAIAEIASWSSEVADPALKIMLKGEAIELVQLFTRLDARHRQQVQRLARRLAREQQR